MTDVRSLLRAERASRRIDHPHASYTATGSLECSVCRIPLKSSADVWSSHLKSTQHAMRAERLRLSSQGPTPISQSNSSFGVAGNGNKKRKASDADDDTSRKRKPKDKDKPTQQSSAPSEDIRGEDMNNAVKFKDAAAPVRVEKVLDREIKPPTNSHQQVFEDLKSTIDEDEWAAFERDVATPPPPAVGSQLAALTAAATITAIPLTAAESAAQSREQAEGQSKDIREADMEGEKEDAARALEEEFDELEGLEERVHRLKQKREALRSNKKAAFNGIAMPEVDAEIDKVPEVPSSAQSSDSEDVDDDWGVIP